LCFVCCCVFFHLQCELGRVKFQFEALCTLSTLEALWRNFLGSKRFDTVLIVSFKTLTSFLLCIFESHVLRAAILRRPGILPIRLNLLLLPLLLLLLLLLCITLHLRNTNQMGEDSRCRGGIVHSRGGCTFSLRKPPNLPRPFGGFV